MIFESEGLGFKARRLASLVAAASAVIVAKRCCRAFGNALYEVPVAAFFYRYADRKV